MTSPSALLYNVFYHIYNRGVNRENVFIEERNYAHFLNLYYKHIEPVAETFAYCLLRNHFHFLVRIKSKETLRVTNPSIQFSNFFNAYAKAINKAYGRTGSLFQHPFGRVPVTSQAQFYRVVMYIHHNPQKHKLIDDFREWEYSSYEILLSDRDTFLQRDAVMDWFGGHSGFAHLHKDNLPEGDGLTLALDDID